MKIIFDKNSIEIIFGKFTIKDTHISRVENNSKRWFLRITKTSADKMCGKQTL